jgi:transcriptional regulator with XRE-family HTH domain
MSGVSLDAAQLRRQLAIRGLCASDLARLAGLSPPTVSQALHGKALSPRTVAALVKALSAVAPLPGHEGLITTATPAVAGQEQRRGRGSR